MREHLLDMLGAVSQERGLDVSLPDLAKAAGVATGTVYRHFDQIQQMRQAFYARALTPLLDDWEQLTTTHCGRELFDAANHRWVEHMSDWARAARYVRSPDGYLAQTRSGDALMARHSQLLHQVVGALITDHTIPDQDLDYATLIWVNLFDERVYVDLVDTLQWDPAQLAARLGATTVAALQATGQDR